MNLLSKLLNILGLLFKQQPRVIDLEKEVKSLYPNAIVSGDLYKDNPDDISVRFVILPGTLQGFPRDLESVARTGDGELIVVVTGTTAIRLQQALAIAPDVTDYLIELLLKHVDLPTLISNTLGSKVRTAAVLIELLAPVLLPLLEKAFEAHNGQISIR